MKIKRFDGIEYDYVSFQYKELSDSSDGFTVYAVCGVRLECDVPFAEPEDYFPVMDLIQVHTTPNIAFMNCDALNKLCFKERLNAGDDKEEPTPSR